MRHYEEVDHTADWAFQVKAQSIEELFSNAAYALFELENAQGDDSAQRNTRTIEVEGIDYESLLVAWLNELLFVQERFWEACSDIQILSVSEHNLKAQIVGIPLKTMDKIIKAVTYHGLKVKQCDGLFSATLIVDV